MTNVSVVPAKAGTPSVSAIALIARSGPAWGAPGDGFRSN